MYYAHIDENSICCGISELSGKITEPGYMEIDSFDASLMGKKYENGEWIEVEPEPETEPEPTEEEEYQAQVLLNQMEILNNQADMDAVIAEILLNQQ